MAGEESIEARTTALVEQGDFKRALELLERERKRALSRGDASSMEDVFFAVKLVDARAGGKQQSQAGRISFAAQQNMRYLGRQAALAAGEEWIDPFPEGRRPAARPAERRRALCGDARRLQSLVIAAVASIGSFPAWLIVSMFAWGLGGDSGGVATPAPADGGRHDYRVVVIVAASLAGASLVATTLDWVRARRRVPVSERLSPTDREVVVYPLAVLLVLGAMIGLFAYLWIGTPLLKDIAPYNY